MNSVNSFSPSPSMQTLQPLAATAQTSVPGQTTQLQADALSFSPQYDQMNGLNTAVQNQNGLQAAQQNTQQSVSNSLTNSNLSLGGGIPGGLSENSAAAPKAATAETAKLPGGSNYKQVPEDVQKYLADRGETISYDNHKIKGKIPLVERQNVRVNANMAAGLDAMLEAAKKDGVDLQLRSGYRSYQQQKNLWDAGMAKRNNNEAENKKWVAKPGGSNHEEGMAVDFKNNTGAHKWVKEHAAEYGFSNYSPEPWHYDFVGFGE